jgi:hypothetical protein
MRSVYALLAATACAVAAVGQSVGPDVVVGDLTGPANYASVPGSGVSAFAIGTAACNYGDQPIRWFNYENPAVPATAADHPVIAQNLYRLVDGRFEHVGRSWVKHGFVALAGSLCLACTPPLPPPGGTAGDYLGVGCSDPYSAALNGNQPGLGPRFEVNPFTGAFPYPPSNPPFAGNDRRLLVADADLAVPGALFFGEAQYVAADDALAGNGKNNASWRPLSVTPLPGGGYAAAFTEETRRTEPAIFAWKKHDPEVALHAMDVPGDGRFWIGYRATLVGPGLWRHVYSVQNLDCDRALRSLTLTVPPGATVSAPYFHDCDPHSGEPGSGTDWTFAATVGDVAWSTTEHAVDPAANALRWGSVFTFAVTANVESLDEAVLGLFKPGLPASLAVKLCPATGLPNALQISYPVVSEPFAPIALGASALPGPAGTTGSLLVDLPFSFPIYDRVLSQVRISVEGYLTAPEQVATAASNTPLGSNVAPNTMIAPFWDNLSTASGGLVRYGTVGTAPARKFVVEWIGIRRAGTTQSESFQVALEEAGGDVVFTWISTDSGGVGATIGIEDGDGGRFEQLGFNAPGTAVAGTAKRLVRTVVVPQTARLTVSGDGSFADPLRFRYVGAPFSLLVLGADLGPGSLDLGPLGVLALDVLSPTYLTLVDGAGIFGPPDAAAAADPCGVWSFSAAIGAGPLPDLDLVTQAIGVNLAAPNGLFDISTVAVIF